MNFSALESFISSPYKMLFPEWMIVLIVLVFFLGLMLVLRMETGGIIVISIFALFWLMLPSVGFAGFLGHYLDVALVVGMLVVLYAIKGMR